MSVSLPLVLVLGVVAWATVRFLGVRLWVVAVIALFGYSLSQTSLDSTIDDGTRSGVEIVNGTDD